MGILNAIRRWKNKRHLKSFGIRHATEDDLDFVMSQLVIGAKNGHYSSHLRDVIAQRQQRLAFSNLLKGIGTTRIGERGPEKLSGSLWIYGNRTVGNIGYLYVSEKYEGSGENEIELTMVGIVEQHQNKGHGKHLVNIFSSLIPPSSTLYARCYPKSESMYQVLLRTGFELINVKPRGTRELERKGLLTRK